jgi:hypothetical protein
MCRGLGGWRTGLIPGGVNLRANHERKNVARSSQPYFPETVVRWNFIIGGNPFLFQALSCIDLVPASVCSKPRGHLKTIVGNEHGHWTLFCGNPLRKHTCLDRIVIENRTDSETNSMVVFERTGRYVQQKTPEAQATGV